MLHNHIIMYPVNFLLVSYNWTTTTTTTITTTNNKIDKHNADFYYHSIHPQTELIIDLKFGYEGCCNPGNHYLGYHSY